MPSPKRPKQSRTQPGSVPEHFRSRLEQAKRESTLQVLFKVARLLDERALQRVAEKRSSRPLRRSHTSLLPHIALEGTRITELADKLGITKQAVSKLVDDLEGHGVLMRVPDREDARARRVMFTKRGREGFFEGLNTLRELEQELVVWIGAPRFQQLRKALLQIHDKLVCLALVTLTVMSFVGCAGSRMLVLPNDLAQAAERYTVAGNVALFTPNVAFGPYKAKASIHGASFRSDETLFNDRTDRDERSQTGVFDLVTPSGMIHGDCVQQRIKHRQHRVGDIRLSFENGHIGLYAPDVVTVVRASYSFRCTLRPSFAPEIQIDLGDPSIVQIRSRELALSITGLHSQTKKMRLAWRLKTGFLILDGDQAIAAFDDSIAYPSATLPTDRSQARKDQLAAIVMALVLLRDMNPR